MFANLATYPKLVGGIGAASTDRAARFYASVLDAEVVAMSSAEAAELSKLADTTYRDVNIAFANEFARAADALGVDVQEVIAAANSQPYSHIHQPGIGVGGHCIPVYPHLLLSRAPRAASWSRRRARSTTARSDRAVATLDGLLGGLAGVPVLVLGLTYREGVKELAYTRALPLIARPARPPAPTSPRRTRCWIRAEVEALRRPAVDLGRRRARSGPIVTQTGDPRVRVDSTRPGSRTSRSSSTAATASGRWPCRTGSRTWASASRRPTRGGPGVTRGTGERP